jgi:hypothetical protein
LSASAIISHTLPIIWTQVAAKHFLQNPDGGPLKEIKNIQHPNTGAIPVD